VQSLAAAFGAALCAGALAQSYPVKPIRIVVPYAPGGAVDIVARAVGQDLTKRLDQSVLVENRTGAGGNVGSDAVAKAAPDGYTLLMASPANTINPTLYTKMPYDPMRDLVPIVLIGSVPTVLIANRSLPVQNVKQLVALAKSQPGALVYGSGGSGTTEHLAGEIFKSAAGVDMLHVPYKGGAQVITDLLGGQIALMFVNQLGALPHITAGKVKALAVASTERSPGYEGLGMVGNHGPRGNAEGPRQSAQPRHRRRVVVARNARAAADAQCTSHWRRTRGVYEVFRRRDHAVGTRGESVRRESGLKVNRVKSFVLSLISPTRQGKPTETVIARSTATWRSRGARLTFATGFRSTAPFVLSLSKHEQPRSHFDCVVARRSVRTEFK
jgi:tripartite-type tricarboxylate transporter receptor subunit TctC